MEKDNQTIANKRKMGSAVDVRSTRKAVRETLVNWARKIPGFNELKNEDQVGLVDCFSNVGIFSLNRIRSNKEAFLNDYIHIDF